MKKHEMSDSEFWFQEHADCKQVSSGGEAVLMTEGSFHSAGASTGAVSPVVVSAHRVRRDDVSTLFRSAGLFRFPGCFLSVGLTESI